MDTVGTVKVAYALMRRGMGASVGWLRIGRAVEMPEGLVITLDAVPVDGRILIRDEPCDVEGDHPGVKGERT